jgi:hypothetical protein
MKKMTPRHIVINLPKTNNKETGLKSSQREQAHHRETKVRVLLEAIEARIQ